MVASVETVLLFCFGFVLICACGLFFVVVFIVLLCGFGYGLLLVVSVLRMFLVDCLL